MTKIKPWKFTGLYTDSENLLTKNLVPSYQVYGEELAQWEGEEYRIWIPKRSKASAMLKKGCKFFPVNQDSRILYLGAANGTTASHLSDIAYSGILYCVEFSKRAFYDLTAVCEIRKNMVPIFADANKPNMYKGIVGKVDLVYQDVSQRDQIGIFLKNIETFLAPKGFGILMIKARSIDVTAKPKDIFKDTARQLKEHELKVLESIILKPYEKDHAAFVVKKITQ
ncbi:MAG: fibrillarin-like rRNA/tRNA 2'-O-methyltransferase [Thermoplasmata archaeon]|nr:MAG: fibrillarin-like rRNA/tRNA 2'-O-methyltransferase [Thermoplasmata archaeon]